MYKKFLAELIGTFGLAFGVLLASQGNLPLEVSTPVFAGLIVGVFVYTIGAISGTHLNPAVTLGALSVKKISRDDAIGYIAAQLIGAGLALAVGSLLVGAPAMKSFASFDVNMALGEAVGTAILTFGIAAVVFGKAPGSSAGLVIGGSLVVGATIAGVVAPGAGFMNPAVALGLRALDFTTIVGPIVGSLAGFWTYRAIA
jgi:glycerol uptake facilitator-like aquaporin